MVPNLNGIAVLLIVPIKAIVSYLLLLHAIENDWKHVLVD